MEIKDILKLVALACLFFAFVFAFFAPFNSIAFCVIYFACAVSDISINHNTVNKNKETSK